MRIDVVTLFPEMVRGVLAYGVTSRAVARGLIDVHTWNPRDHASNVHRSVDDRPYGGGPGMVMMVEPLLAAIRAARTARTDEARTIYLSAQGRPLHQAALVHMAAGHGMIVVAGRYEGVDERLIQVAIDEEWSLGDYVMSGGELPAMVLIDVLARLQPGALGDEGSAAQESFMHGLLDYPHYTRPRTVEGLPVPPVLLQGDHAAIERWRRKQALGRTALRRPELLTGGVMNAGDQRLLDEFMREEKDSSGLLNTDRVNNDE
ncbi:MAG: tRNA (guanosine(37)-N1)-methyltransferase TrmD [Gammaproteobacteria bacterium]